MMLCNVCIRLVSQLLELVKDDKEKDIRGPVRDFVKIPEILDSEEQRKQECYICSQMKRAIERLDVRLRGTLEGEMRFDVYYYKGTEQTGKNFVTNTFLVRHADETVYNMARESGLSPNTGSKESQELISYWFTDCVLRHPKCGIRQEEQWYPRRLLDVSKQDFCILKTSEHIKNGPYVTMSHCWGKEKCLTLTAENMEEFEAGIETSSLPRNFQDAIRVTQLLGIRYIWIDCYCIVQDSHSGEHVAEKLLDIAQMKRVYMNSVLNIAASHASGPRDGCFVERDLSSKLPQSFIKYEADGHPGKDLFHVYNVLESQEYVRKLSSHHIFSRAWVLQERLLCPRIIHFGADQIYWECQELLPACELFPSGQKSQPATTVFSTEDQDLTFSARYTWCRTVEDYSAMQLSHPVEDKLVAIGGIAEHVGNHTGDEYVAGLFKDNFILQMCWEADYLNPRRAKEWRAPSWSWASMDSKVFLESHLLANSVYTAMLFIHGPEVELIDSTNIYGPLKSASVTLTGRPIAVKLNPGIRKPEGNLARDSYLFFKLASGDYSLEIHMDDPSNADLSNPDLYILPICMVFVSEDDIFSIEDAIKYPQDIQEHGTLHGLLVEKVSPSEYVRQGCMLSYVASEESRPYGELLKAWVCAREEKMVLL